ncbi:ef hand family protein [Stylonychia lemnae]|uniref:Ef hand family protein n=1 Tax=Stylonychia lemnae TaxID=5949 RepID=A0A078AQG0_STYLE|nr:ef hand family protein [Stylonychia lemnae]|eukprot:CDW84384.1 ef hand family protein [Stylonychia lemnae]
MEEIEEIFNSYDIGQKGQIEVSQLAIMFEENGVNVSEQDLRAIFNIVDDDKNGTLSLEEFKKFINSDDAQLKFRNIALQMRQRIEEDYQMFRIAEKQYLPLNFNKMLTYLFQKTVYRQTLKQLQSQDVQNKNTINDMHTFIKLFSGKNELVVESSNMIENQSVVTQFKSFNSVRESTTGGELDLNNQKTFTSDFFEPQLKALDLRHLSHQQQSYRSTNEIYQKSPKQKEKHLLKYHMSSSQLDQKSKRKKQICHQQQKYQSLRIIMIL